MHRKPELIRHDYKKEEDVCLAFTERARAQGWRVFPENNGQADLLLVATDKVLTVNAKPGDQIAVQAKLTGNVEVIYQAIPHAWSDSGPDFHAVLVPVVTREFGVVARQCGIVAFEVTRRVWRPDIKRWARERGVDHQLIHLPPGKRHYYRKPLWHPDVELWTPPGVARPAAITPWKLKAIQLCLDCLNRGFITSGDFSQMGVSISTWHQKKWLTAVGKVGRLTKYKLVDANTPPHLKYPDLTKQIADDQGLSFDYRKPE